jgi:hypothetical protein
VFIGWSGVVGLDFEYIYMVLGGLGEAWIIADAAPPGATLTIDEYDPSAFAAGWHHWANVLHQVDDQWRGYYYWDGRRRLTQTVDPYDFGGAGPEYFFGGSTSYVSSVSGVYGTVGDTPDVWESYGASPFRIHGFRYTPRALYSGDTFTPPTSITRPA